jgi:hypothetical protein
MRAPTIKAIEADPTYKSLIWAERFRPEYSGHCVPMEARKYKLLSIQISELARQGCRFAVAGEVITAEIGTFQATYNIAGWPTVCKDFINAIIS